MSENIEQKCLAKGVKLTDQRKIIAKIRNVDERIEQKINVVSLSRTSSKPSDINKLTYHHIIENGDELTKIILRLIYSRALGSMHSEEQDEFNYVRELNKMLNIIQKNIQSPLSRQDKRTILELLQKWLDDKKFFHKIRKPITTA